MILSFLSDLSDRDDSTSTIIARTHTTLTMRRSAVLTPRDTTSVKFRLEVAVTAVSVTLNAHVGASLHVHEGGKLLICCPVAV